MQVANRVARSSLCFLRSGRIFRGKPASTFPENAVADIADHPWLGERLHGSGFSPRAGSRGRKGPADAEKNAYAGFTTEL
jgi:hypothetical protein